MIMKWWARWQMALQLMPVVNVSLLVISASPVISRALECRTAYVVGILPVAILLLMCLVGWGMDRAGYVQKTEEQHQSRSPAWKDLFERLERIERRLK